MRYAIVVGEVGNNFSAYVPDLPGCLATGFSMEKVEHEMQEAIELHIEVLIEDRPPNAHIHRISQIC